MRYILTKMKTIFLFTFLLSSIIICFEPLEYLDTNLIIFTNNEIKVPEERINISGSTVLIEKPGFYLATGESEEGNIVIKSSQVILYLQNLKLSSSTTAPIIITSNLKDVEIINIENTELNDLEKKSTTEGECSVIKIKKNSRVTFINNDIFKMNGDCKYIIKGGSQTSIIFKKSSREYIINARKTAIDSDGLLEFNGGLFNIYSEKGDAIKSIPDDSDTESLGKILINDGTFNIHCFNDAFSAKNNITIVKGKFDIQTEEGYDSETFNETESSKGFKITNNETGCGIKIYSGNFKINTADDAFRSNRDITIISGNFAIETKDDAICAKYDLVLGKKDAPVTDLNITILSSYEAIEGMTVVIYSAKIRSYSDDDGINASGPIKKERRSPGPRNNSRDRNDTNRNETNRNRSRDNPWDGSAMRRNHTGAPPNDSYWVSIYNCEIDLFTNSDGIDANGHLFIHGGNINIFSEGRGANEPIDHNGNFTLFNAEILGVGTGGLEFVHEGIKKGNQMYGFYSGMISKDKMLEIKDENNQIIKTGKITKDINYIFYTSSKINDKYKFTIYDENNNNNKMELNVTFGMPNIGKDDLDKHYNNIINNEKKNNNREEQNNYSNPIKVSILNIFIILTLI